VTAVTQTADIVEFYTRRQGLSLVVRDRAFVSAEDRVKFVAQAREYCERAGRANGESMPDAATRVSDGHRSTDIKK
jgi:hypothetical protein